MATLEIPRKGTSALSAAPVAGARMIDVVVNLATDVTMGTATDVINVATLAKGTIVLAAGVEQIVAGTGTGTLVARVGTTSTSAVLTSTDAAGTVPAGAAINPIILGADTQLNLLGATAVRTDGIVRVFAVVVEGTRSPARATSAARDASL